MAFLPSIENILTPSFYYKFDSYFSYEYRKKKTLAVVHRWLCSRGLYSATRSSFYRWRYEVRRSMFDIVALIIVGDIYLLEGLPLVSQSFSRSVANIVELHDAVPNYHLTSLQKGFLKLPKSRPNDVCQLNQQWRSSALLCTNISQQFLVSTASQSPFTVELDSSWHRRLFTSCIFNYIDLLFICLFFGEIIPYHIRYFFIVRGIYICCCRTSKLFSFEQIWLSILGFI